MQNPCLMNCWQNSRWADYIRLRSIEHCSELMDTEEFAECLEGKTFEEIVHKAKKESEKRMTSIPEI